MPRGTQVLALRASSAALRNTADTPRKSPKMLHTSKEMTKSDHSSRTRCSWIAVAALGGACVSAWISTARGAESLDIIKRSLSEQANSLSPIELEWSVQRSSSMEGGALMTLLGYADYDAVEFFTEKSVTFRWQDKMIYLSQRGTTVELTGNPAKISRRTQYGREYAYNHKYFYKGDAEKETRAEGLVPMLVVDTVDEPIEHHAKHRVFSPDYLSAVGFWTPQTFGDLGRTATHELLRLLEEGAVLESVSPTELYGIKCEKVDVAQNGVRSCFVFDPSRGYALIQRKDIEIKSGLPITLISGSEYRQVSNRLLWMPNRIQVHCFMHSGKRDPRQSPLYVDTFALRSVSSRDLELDAFILRYKQPGTIVVDYNLPDARSSRKGYVIPADLSDVEGVLSDGTRTSLLLLNGAALIVLTGILVWRVARKRSNSR